MLDCQSCGACCVSTGDGAAVREHGYADLSEEDVVRLPPRIRRQLQPVEVDDEIHFATRAKRLPSGTYGCRYLEGTPGQRCSCEIYDVRPAVCRDFQVGGATCLAARLAATRSKVT